MTPDANETYSIIKEYAAPNFFDDFWYDNRNGHVFGFSRFADNKTAWEEGLVAYRNNQVYIGADHTNIVPNNTWGRMSVRINSFQRYSSGLFLLSMDHLPVGPYATGSGWHSSPVWPAFWFVGESGTNGEFDAYEGFNPNDFAFVTLINWASWKWGNCTNLNNITSYYNGSGWDHNRMTLDTPHGTADMPFNNAGGGVYAVQWSYPDFIRTWTFVKPNVPADITNGSPNPNPDTWGQPHSYFPFGTNCNPNVINDVYMVLNIAFCNAPNQDFCLNTTG
uniref:GH16 domain-containing protein n=1 Tax=Acrobeloides nanus TaxID=290746 RepID=A0A914D607_9BILA